MFKVQSRLLFCYRILHLKKLKRSVCSKKVVTGDLSTAYQSNQVENYWYRRWEENGFFTSEEQTDHKVNAGRFSMVLPPPNVTGSLHLGHALTNSIQDAIIRWHRMHGKKVVWIPGCDHAGIATQVMVEKKLWKEEGKSRHDMEREEFLRHVWLWKEKQQNRIYEQLRRLGSSLDWSKSLFTMDPLMETAVKEAFVQLHDAGLMVRRYDTINWCCHLRSTISDIEVEHVELPGRTKLKIPGYKDPMEFGVLNYIAYEMIGSNDKIVVATTRPETIFGDTAIAVHPDDARYSRWHGQSVRNPLTSASIPIVCDISVNQEFGTGAVKVTPAHDSKDFQVSQRHNLPAIEVIGDDGLMNEKCNEFQVFPRFEARKAIVKLLKDRGQLEKEEPRAMSLPLCSRSGDVIESKLKYQWFVKTSSLSKRAIDVVKDGSLEILPKNYEEQWIRWLSEDRDWCVSRQLLWGHRIPAYRVTVNNNEQEIWTVGRNVNEAAERAAKKLDCKVSDLTLEQDEDVLDTWFSSALFPLATMGWPEKSAIREQFYPLDLMETGHDILLFWVTKMVMLCQKLTGELPFNKVLLHGLICDSHGRKMSKSLGNVIDPMDIVNGITLEQLHQQLDDLYLSGGISEVELKKAKSGQKKDFPNGIPACSADGLRFALCSYDVKSQFISLDIRKVRHFHLFCNKIWQATRFIVGFVEKSDQSPANMELGEYSRDELSLMDKWILSRQAMAVKSCNLAFETHDLHHSTRALHKFFYSEFCDVYLEAVKPILQTDKRDEIAMTAAVLIRCLHTSLLLLSPFMPFLTEELYQRLRLKAPSPTVAFAQYPRTTEWTQWADEKLEDDVKLALDVVDGVRSVRHTYALKQKPTVAVDCSDPSAFKAISDLKPVICTLLRIDSLDVNQGIITENSDGCEIRRVISANVSVGVIAHDSKVDQKEQFARLSKKEEKIKAELNKLVGRMQTDRYRRSCPENVQQADLAARSALEAKLDEIKSNVETLEKLVLKRDTAV